MRIINSMLALATVILTGTSFVAQDRQKIAVEEKWPIDIEAKLSQAAYTREVWIGIGSKSVTQDDLMRALERACGDTTSVAAVKRVRDGEFGDLLEAEERAALDSLTGRYLSLSMLAKLGLWNLFTGVTPARKHVRIVLVGVMDGADTALRIAKSKQSEVDGVVLIDPPVGDLTQIDDGAKAVGVDVLVHPRSDAEFKRDEAEIRKRLGPWGKTARVLRGANPFGDLHARVSDAWGKLRGYTIEANGDDRVAQPIDGVGAVLVQLARVEARVWHIGELHGNPGAHRIQLEALRAMVASGEPLALSTEQFERDVQGKLDAYLKGEITEEQFLKDSRPWPNYADYRPLIELCKEKKIPVIAGNIPRRLASRVHKEGIEVIEKFSDEEKAWAAKKLNATPGAYRDKFMKAMGAAEGHNAKLDSMYAAQCIKDDTMAESIAEWLRANPKGRVLHINGAFHSENGLGVPEKLKALMPEIKQAMLTCYEAGKETPKAVENEWYVRVPASRP